MKKNRKRLISSILCISTVFTCLPRSHAVISESSENTVLLDNDCNAADNDENAESSMFKNLSKQQAAVGILSSLILLVGGGYGIKKFCDYCKSKKETIPDSERASDNSEHGHDVSSQEKQSHYPKYESEYDKLYLNASFLKNTESISKFIKEELPKACEILKKQPAVTSLTNAKRTMFIGDVHGTKECLEYLIPATIDFLKTDSRNCIVVTGDFIDRHMGTPDESFASSLWFFYLLINYPNQVRILRGNHESVRHGLNSSLSSWWGPEFESCMKELPLACRINEDYIALHGGIDNRLNLNNNTLNKPDLYGGEWGVQNGEGSLPFQIMWNDFRQIGDSRRHYCDPNFTTAWMNNNKVKYIIRGHDPFMNPVLDLQNGKYVLTVHSNSVVGPKACQKLNARILIVDHTNNSIKFNYFLDKQEYSITDPVLYT